MIDPNDFTQLGVGSRLPVIEHTLTTVDIAIGAAGSRDWLPQHYDKAVAVAEIGLVDVLINTPMIASFFERLITDWTGPLGRIGRIRLGLRRSILSGETPKFAGEVTDDRTDATGCRWLTVAATMSVDGEKRVDAHILVAVPTSGEDNPWRRRGAQWQPA